MSDMEHTERVLDPALTLLRKYLHTLTHGVAIELGILVFPVQLARVELYKARHL